MGNGPSWLTQDAHKGGVLTHPTPARQDVLFRRQGRSERRGEANVSDVEPLSEVRTPHGKRRVSARQGWAGEKSDFFSVLLEVEPELSIAEILIGAGAQVLLDIRAGEEVTIAGLEG